MVDVIFPPQGQYPGKEYNLRPGAFFGSFQIKVMPLFAVVAIVPLGVVGAFSIRTAQEVIIANIANQLENCIRRAVLLCSGDVILEERVKLEGCHAERSGLPICTGWRTCATSMDRFLWHRLYSRAGGIRGTGVSRLPWVVF